MNGVRVRGRGAKVAVIVEWNDDSVIGANCGGCSGRCDNCDDAIS